MRAQPGRSEEPAGNGFVVLAGSSYLQQLGTLVALTALVGTLLDYVFKVRAAATFPRRAS